MIPDRGQQLFYWDGKERIYTFVGVTGGFWEVKDEQGRLSTVYPEYVYLSLIEMYTALYKETRNKELTFHMELAFATSLRLAKLITESPSKEEKDL